MQRRRSKARKLALQMLYAADICETSAEDIITVFAERYKNAAPDIWAFATLIVKGIFDKRKKIDELINLYSKHWQFDRLAIIDCNILRLSIFELLDTEKTPFAVIINEGIELAKCYSTEDSSRFINGLLDTIKEDVSMVGETIIHGGGR